MEKNTNVKIMADIRDTNNRKPDWSRLNRVAHLVICNKKSAGRCSYAGMVQQAICSVRDEGLVHVSILPFSSYLTFMLIPS